MLGLKAEYKSSTGKDWKPGAAPPTGGNNTSGTASTDELNNRITAQGDKIRGLKSAKAAKVNRASYSIFKDIKIYIHMWILYLRK